MPPRFRSIAWRSLYGDGGKGPAAQGVAAVVYHRSANPKGPMSVFGYDYLVDHFGKAQTSALALPAFKGLRAEGESYTIEALNFVDGRRTVQAIRDSLTAEFGPVPVADVAEYLSALEKIGVLHR